ncbi:4569_t:CDS:2, partial [Paraglomus brasilianum]
MESYITDNNSFPQLMQSTEIYPQLPSPEMAVSDQSEGEVPSSPSQHSQLMTPPPSSDLQILTNEQEEHDIELDVTGADGYNNVFMYMSNDFSVDALIDQFDSIPTCEELCQTLNNWTDSYKAEQTICSSCGQAFVEGTLWCITCDADQIIVDDAWAENAEIVDDSDDMGQQLEMLDYEFLGPSLDGSDIDQKQWIELLENGMFSNTEGGSEEDINKIGHF